MAKETKDNEMIVVEEKYARLAMSLIMIEYAKACNTNPPFNSYHEGYAVLLEEVDELWEEVRKKTKNQDKKLMLKEATQVGAMALRIMTDLCLGKK